MTANNSTNILCKRAGRSSPSWPDHWPKQATGRRHKGAQQENFIAFRIREAASVSAAGKGVVNRVAQANATSVIATGKSEIS